MQSNRRSRVDRPVGMHNSRNYLPSKLPASWHKSALGGLGLPASFQQVGHVGMLACCVACLATCLQGCFVVSNLGCWDPCFYLAGDGVQPLTQTRTVHTFYYPRCENCHSFMLFTHGCINTAVTSLLETSPICIAFACALIRLCSDFHNSANLSLAALRASIAAGLSLAALRASFATVRFSSLSGSHSTSH